MLSVLLSALGGIVGVLVVLWFLGMFERQPQPTEIDEVPQARTVKR